MEKKQATKREGEYLVQLCHDHRLGPELEHFVEDAAIATTCTSQFDRTSSQQEHGAPRMRTVLSS